MSHQDKIVLITGSGSGIGKVSAQLYAKEGASLIISDINEQGGHETVKEIKAAGGEAMFIKANVAKYEDVKSLIDQIVSTYGRLDIAVNNAGIANKRPLRTADADIEDWERVMSVNTTGVFYCMKEELKQMMKQGSGSIINIASIAGLKGLPSSLSYVASKHAVVGMTKTAAMEYARHNIRINAVCPVFTITPMFQPDAMEQISAGLSEKLKNGVPMKRFAQPSEMAEAILWLSSEKASFITGHSLPVDGGLMA